MYAELTGNRKKYRIKSRYDNKTVAEGRILYDAFVLKNKAPALYYHGTSDVAPLVRAAADAETQSVKAAVKK